MNTEIYKCEYCNKQYKNRISLGQHRRFCKLNPNAQISPFVKFNKHIGVNNCIWNKGLSKETDARVKKQSDTLKMQYKCGKISNKFKGKHLSEDHKKKISASQKARLEQNKELTPYILNHSSKQSYPEKYFSDIFKNDALLCRCIQQYRVNRFRLDFAIPDIKIYIEIDGEQHYNDARIIKHDKERTKILESLGWTGFRIRWSKFIKKPKELKFDELNIIKKQIIAKTG